MHCPHCGTPAIARTSRAVTPIYREIHFRCDNIECGHTFAAALSILRTISPSACPNPAIHLPMSKPRRPQPPANDDLPEPISLPPTANRRTADPG